MRGKDQQFCSMEVRPANERSEPRQQAHASSAMPIRIFDQTLLYKHWDDVPSFPPLAMRARSVFLEVFSGKAGLTRAMRRRGWLVLPPIDIVVEGEVLSATNILDPKVMQKVQNWLQSGVVALVHFGTPCTTFSRARKHGDGGPPPIRSEQFLEGVPGISTKDQDKVRLGTQFLDITLLLCEMVVNHGGHWSIENPSSSMLWIMPQTIALLGLRNSFLFTLDMCAFGSEHMKPTTFASSHACLQGMVRKCPGLSLNHVHIPLQGTVMVNGEEVFRTKLAQVYPEELCNLFASQADTFALKGSPALSDTNLLRHPTELAHRAGEISLDPLKLGSSSLDGAQFSATFAMVTPTSERKRQLGTPARFEPHRQASSGSNAVRSGYQMKRGVVPPLFLTEVEPGVAVQQALKFIHPFTVEFELDPQLNANLDLACQQPDHINNFRAGALAYWEKQAQELLPVSLVLLDQISDTPLRQLLRGVPDNTVPELGQFFHVALWRAMAAAGSCKDQHLVDEMLHGMTIVGDIARSFRWPALLKKDEALPVALLLDRAWDIRAKIMRNASGVPLTAHSKEIWDSTIEDRDEGSCLGPFWSVEEVSKSLGTDRWVPTQRFEVVQKSKVRGCDSATVNLVNQVTHVTEKLQLPSTDANVACIRKLRTKAQGKGLVAWVLDERKAYRQIGVKPEERKFSVITFRHYDSGKLAFFIMVGHSFGLVSAVYNYNRRSALLDEILRNVFKLVSFNFYDDKFGFETEVTARSAFDCAQKVHHWLGARFDAQKLQFGSEVDILGVTYDLKNFILKIKQSRKEEITEEIASIQSVGFLEPGHAGKLKGKLMFGASQLWGKVGRAFFLAFSERQYGKKFAAGGSTEITEPLRLSLAQWSKLVNNGPPREINPLRSASADVVIFTDGFTPDQRKNEKGASRIGATVFCRCAAVPAQFGAVVPQEVIDKWLPRATQICMVELVATVVALHTFEAYLRGKTVLLLVDAEAVEGALVKGYSSRSDLCELVGVFWDIVVELRALIYIDRIPTDANCSDPPSRDKFLIGEELGWKTVPAHWPKQVWGS
jgi:hypothetical protein